MRRSRSGPFALVTMVMAAIIASATLGSGVASAATTVIVSPIQHQGWSTADTRPGGTVMFVDDNDPMPPYPDGALQLTNAATGGNANTPGGAKAQYLHQANVPLSGVTDLSYHTKRVSGPAIAAASYQFLVDLNGAGTGGFTTFVFEPYQNGVVAPASWQFWDVDAGQMWSSRNFTEGTCVVAAGGGGPPFYTLAALKTACPNAVAVGFGVNVGTNNPGYDVYTDGVTFNDTTYDFELQVGPPTSKKQCKNGGFASFNSPRTFKNQGDCIKFVEKQNDDDDDRGGDRDDRDDDRDDRDDDDD